jgi:hypothetical protein
MHDVAAALKLSKGGLARNDLQIGLAWPVWLRAALLPVPESAEGMC